MDKKRGRKISLTLSHAWSQDELTLRERWKVLAEYDVWVALTYDELVDLVGAEAEQLVRDMVKKMDKASEPEPSAEGSAGAGAGAAAQAGAAGQAAGAGAAAQAGAGGQAPGAGAAAQAGAVGGARPGAPWVQAPWGAHGQGGGGGL
jgi:hypothetical protein